MIVDNQKNQEKEIKLILQLLNAIKAKHTLSVQEAEEGKEAVFKRVEEKLGRRYNLTATRRTRLFRYWPVAASIAILILLIIHNHTLFTCRSHLHLINDSINKEYRSLFYL